MINIIPLLISSLLTEKLLKHLLVFILERFSRCTKSKVDDELVARVRLAFDMPPLPIHILKEDEADKASIMPLLKQSVLEGVEIAKSAETVEEINSSKPFIHHHE